MTTVYFDSKMTDAERRAKLFEGDIFVFSPRPSTLALIDFARELLEEAFAPLPPRTAQFDLPVEKIRRDIWTVEAAFYPPSENGYTFAQCRCGVRRRPGFDPR